ncbi:MAG: type II toxin-antitoxin system VapC family toxin, partial [Candidatus Limnocylindrales bacterium]
MILLLDAHALLWWLADDPTLDRGAFRAIQDPANDVLVSAATVWEIAIKRSIGKLEAPDGLVAVIDQAGMDLVAVTGADGEAAGGLPARHRDPFD